MLSCSHCNVCDFKNDLSMLVISSRRVGPIHENGTATSTNSKVCF